MDQLLLFEWSDIDIAYGLARGGRYERPAADARWQLSSTQGNTKLATLFSTTDEWSGFVRLECHPYLVRVFGEVWNLGDALAELGPATLRLAKEGDGRLRVEVTGKKGAVFGVRKVETALDLATESGVV